MALSLEPTPSPYLTDSSSLLSPGLRTPLSSFSLTVPLPSTDSPPSHPPSPVSIRSNDIAHEMTAPKSIKCPVPFCSQSFSERNKSRHMWTHRPAVVTEDCVCVCNVIFTRTDACQRHMVQCELAGYEEIKRRKERTRQKRRGAGASPSMTVYSPETNSLKTSPSPFRVIAPDSPSSFSPAMRPYPPPRRRRRSDSEAMQAAPFSASYLLAPSRSSRRRRVSPSSSTSHRLSAADVTSASGSPCTLFGTFEHGTPGNNSFIPYAAGRGAVPISVASQAESSQGVNHHVHSGNRPARNQRKMEVASQRFTFQQPVEQRYAAGPPQPLWQQAQTSPDDQTSQLSGFMSASGATSFSDPDAMSSRSNDMYSSAHGHAIRNMPMCDISQMLASASVPAPATAQPALSQAPFQQPSSVPIAGQLHHPQAMFAASHSSPAGAGFEMQLDQNQMFSTQSMSNGMYGFGSSDIYSSCVSYPLAPLDDLEHLGDPDWFGIPDLDQSALLGQDEDHSAL